MKAGLFQSIMGNDLSVVNAAKVSFAKAGGWLPSGSINDYEGVVYQTIDGMPVNLSKGDASLIGYLARGMPKKEWEGVIGSLIETEQTYDQVEATIKDLMFMAQHWVPFTHTAISLRMQAPVPIRTQAFKHKMGFTESEESRRYIDSRPELYIPENFYSSAENVKQGKGGIHNCSDVWKDRYVLSCTNAINLYEDMIEAGIAPEQARFVLPQGVEVNWIWTGNLASFARYYNQRTDEHAQGESALLAHEVGQIIAPYFPVSWAALTRPVNSLEAS